MISKIKCLIYLQTDAEANRCIVSQSINERIEQVSLVWLDDKNK